MDGAHVFRDGKRRPRPDARFFDSAKRAALDFSIETGGSPSNGEQVRRRTFKRMDDKQTIRSKSQLSTGHRRP